jgi:hypothetical protein
VSITCTDPREVIDRTGTLSLDGLLDLCRSRAPGSLAALEQAWLAAREAGRPVQAVWLAAFDAGTRRQSEVLRQRPTGPFTGEEDWVPWFDLGWAGARGEENGPAWAVARAAVAALAADLIPEHTYWTLWGHFPPVEHTLVT